MKPKSFFLLFLLAPLIAFTQEAFKINHGPYLQALGETGVNIVWTTNKNAISWVEIAPDDSTHFYHVERKKYYASQNGLKTEANIHNVRIDGLTPATTYRYRIYSQEVLSHESYIIQYGKIDAAAAYSNNSILKANANENRLLIEMFDLKGKLMDTITIQPTK